MEALQIIMPIDTNSSILEKMHSNEMQQGDVQMS